MLIKQIKSLLIIRVRWTAQAQQNFIFIHYIDTFLFMKSTHIHS